MVAYTNTPANSNTKAVKESPVIASEKKETKAKESKKSKD